MKRIFSIFWFIFFCLNFVFHHNIFAGGGKDEDPSSSHVSVRRDPSSRNEERLATKLQQAKPASADGSPVSWSQARAITPNSLTFLIQQPTMAPLRLDPHDNTEVVPFREGQESQGIVRASDRSLGGSVTGKITTATKRTDEKKSTFIQYDRGWMETHGKDFPVRARNYRSRINYDGGHLIDHKYSAEGSHTDPRNYVPQHYFYNSPLKEHLVQGCDEFVEIPLYTPNPPRIGVKGKPDVFDEIPIGITLIQIVGGKIKDVYFFPNNDYDYEVIKRTLGLKKGEYAKGMVPFFRLKKALHCLFEPACLFDVSKNPSNSSEQSTLEGRAFKRVDDLAFGISLAECDENEGELSRIGFSVVQQQQVDPLDFLDIKKQDLGKIRQVGLQQPFDEFGRFLIYYALRNGLKSEFLSTHSRLVFINLIIDFFEGYHQVEEETLNFVDDMEDDFNHSLKELKNIAHTMNTEELLFLANTYKRLADPSIQDFAVQGHSIYADDDIFRYLKKLIYILRILDKKVKTQNLEARILFNLIELHTDAQECVAYAYQVMFGEPDENVEQAREFLHKKKAQVIEWSERYSGGGQRIGVNEAYESGVNRISRTRTSMGYVQQKMGYGEQWNGKST